MKLIAGVITRVVPTFLESKVCVRLAVSPLARLPDVMAGTPEELFVPLYVLESAVAVTVIARAVMSKAGLVAPVRLGLLDAAKV